MSNIHSPAQHTLEKCLSNGVAVNGNGASVDCLGYTRALLKVIGSSSAASGAVITLQDSPDNTNFTAVASAGATVTIATGLTASEYALDINLGKRQRYLRAPVSATSGTVVATVTLQLFNPQYARVPATAWDNTPSAI